MTLPIQWIHFQFAERPASPGPYVGYSFEPKSTTTNRKRRDIFLGFEPMTSVFRRQISMWYPMDTFH
ncbi:hypothetical protein RESH_03409 [Rhodopirellula europaea SH398]|uniref:Uncharacterized protein n=1 Tax=Rhodopirellula europaea SH398 TaxID=1263868 RepID=M5SEF2_9BACT|nr:hypothetical protein RESH_03409 [Rhodopirellula europaea SH398]